MPECSRRRSRVVRHTLWVVFWFAGLMLGGLAGRARADGTASSPPSPPSPSLAGGAMAADPSSSANEPVSDVSARLEVSTRPWAIGVSPERQEAALKHLQEGNGLLKESLFVAAAKVYRQALTEWDHPGIHYNLALALLNMDQPVEVYQNLEAAIKFGAEPLDPEKLEHAKSYLRLIERQVASVDIRCDVEGADVTFDGQPLFRAPGHYQSLVRAGTHTITASKSGFTPTSRTESLAYDKHTALNLKLYTAGELIEYRRHYPLWRPVAVTIAGAALLATGVVMSLEARSRYQTYDQSTAVCVSSNPGCTSGDGYFSALQDMKRQGDNFQRLATIAYAVGGATLAAGVLLVVLDRSTPYRVDPDGEWRERESDRDRDKETVSSHRSRSRASRRWALPALSPMLAPGLAGLAGVGTF